jgi:pimeloyl-ACP methyl ester carboxylesterase
LDIPMLWIFGEYDSESDLTKNLQILETLKKEEAKDYKVIVYPGAGHGIMSPIDSFDNKLGPLATPPNYFVENLKFIQGFK